MGTHSSLGSLATAVQEHHGHRGGVQSGEGDGEHSCDELPPIHSLHHWHQRERASENVAGSLKQEVEWVRGTKEEKISGPTGTAEHSFAHRA